MQSDIGMNNDLEDFYKTILDSIIDGVWVSDKDDIIFYTNKGMEIIAGIPAENFIDARVLKDFPESTLKDFIPHYLKAKISLKSVYYDAVPVITPAGRQSYQSGWLIPKMKDGNYDGMICTVEDITERKLYTKKLQENEKRLNYVQKIAHLGFWDWDILTGDLYWSDEAYRIFGLKPQEIVPSYENFMNIIHPGDRDLVQQHIDSTLKDNTKYDIDFRFIRPNGEIGYISAQGDVTRNGEGTPIRFVGTQIDITERKKLEEELKRKEEKLEKLNKDLEQKFEERTKELKESEKRFSTAFYMNSNLCAISKVEDGTYVEVNDMFLKTIQTTREEIIGKSAINIYQDPKDREFLLAELKEKGKVSNYELNFKNMNGDPLVGLFSFDLVDMDGKPYLISIAQNITEKKMAEQKLKESEEEFRSIFEYAPVGITQVAPDGSIINPNQKFCEIMNYSREEMLSMTFQDIIHPDDVMENITTRNKLLKGEISVYSTETRFRCKDRLIVWVNLTVTLLRDASQNPKYFISIIEDISVKKKLEEERNKFFNLPLHLLIVSGLDGIIKRVNPGWNERLGYETEELEGKSFFDLVHPDDIAATISEMDKLSEGITTFQFENRYRHKNGTYRTLAWSATSDLEKGVVYAIAHDISERKDAEQKLKESEHDLKERVKELKFSEEKLRMFMESATDGFHIFDSKLNYLEANEVSLEFLNMNKEELIGKNLLDIVPNLKETGRYDKYLEVIKTGEPFSTEDVIFNRLDGSLTKQLSVRAFKVGDNLGIIFTDITESKMAEKQLKESEEKHRDLYENAPNAYYSIDINKKIKNCNKMAIKLLGYTKEELNNMKVFDLYAENQYGLPKARLIFQDFLKGNKCMDEELQMKRKDGSTVWVSLTVIPVKDRDGNMIESRSMLIDISERKDAEGKGQMYLDLVDTIVVALDKDGNIEMLNDHGYKILGRETGSLERLNWFKYCLPPHDNDRVLEYFKNLIKGEIDFIPYYENPVVTRDGTERMIAWSGVLLHDNLGNRNGILSSGQDITERMKTEQQLKESEEKYRTMITTLDVGYNNVTLDGTIIYHNPAFNKIIGHDPKENLIGSRVQGLWETPKDREIFLEQILKSGFVKDYVIHAKRINGEKIVLLENSHLLKNQNNEPISIEGTISDITDKYVLEQKLKESEEKFRTLAEQSLMGIYIAQDNKIKYINKAYADIFGYSVEKMVKWNLKDVLNVIHPDDRNFALNQLAKKQKGEKDVVINYQYRGIKKSGEVIWVEQYSKTVLYEDKSAEFITLIDITERKQVEQELIKLNIMKSEFLRRTSHELKTPLVSIKGFSNLLLELHGDELDDQVLSTINEITQGCTRLETLVKDILRTAQLESDKLTLQKSREDLVFLLRFCVNELRGFSELRHQMINLKSNDKLIVNFEKEAVHDVITNLLSNAIKYTPPFGKIEIKTEIHDDQVVISIKDNGIGFTEEEKKKIFTQFGKIERYGQGLDVVSEGSGLGLYVSKKIVELHGGNIWLESGGRNQGSTFYFSLPIGKD